MLKSITHNKHVISINEKMHFDVEPADKNDTGGLSYTGFKSVDDAKARIDLHEKGRYAQKRASDKVSIPALVLVTTESKFGKLYERVQSVVAVKVRGLHAAQGRPLFDPPQMQNDLTIYPDLPAVRLLLEEKATHTNRIAEINKVLHPIGATGRTGFGGRIAPGEYEGLVKRLVDDLAARKALAEKLP